MTENTKKTIKTKRGPYRSQLVARGDVSHARDIAFCHGFNP